MTRLSLLATLALFVAVPLSAQDTAAAGGPARRGPPPVVITDTARARELFVSKNPTDLAGCGRQCDRQIAAKQATDSIYEARSRGVMEFRKVTYKSREDGLEIPAYLFAPLDKGTEKHAAMIWVHGGVHGDWTQSMYPFVREAVQRGYVVITPDYRGSTGYGDAWYKMIDYGGKEVDDVVSAVDFLKSLSYVPASGERGAGRQQGVAAGSGSGTATLARTGTADLSADWDYSPTADSDAKSEEQVRSRSPD